MSTAETEPTSLVGASARVIASLVRRGACSSEDVVLGHLRHIEKVNRPINAVVQLRAEQALQEARHADDRLRKRSRLGPLHGVPVTVKDSLDVSGVISTAGTLGLAARVASRDATVVARLRRAGAIVLGKTNVPELCLAYETDNLIYGRTNNPYDLSRTPGGSSGGEAAILATGGSCLGIASDSGGSIRIPAGYCGLASLKPTSGLIPRTGHLPEPSGLTQPLLEVGPIARTVADLAIALRVMIGPDGEDPAVISVRSGDRGSERRALRVAFFVHGPDVRCTDDVEVATRRAAETLEGLGHRVTEVRLEVFWEALEVQMGLLGADGGAGLEAALSSFGTGPDQRHSLVARLLTVLAQYGTTAAGLSVAADRLSRFRQRLFMFMKDWDAILCPVAPAPAPRHGTTFDPENWRGYTLVVAFNLTGWPVVAVRSGTTGDGLPIGVQVAAKPFREDIALRLAQSVEDVTGGWTPPPLAVRQCARGAPA